MKQVRLRNTSHRMFVADLEKSPTQEKNAVRSLHNPKTGEVSMQYVAFHLYKQLSLLAYETSQPMDISVLNNASVQGAVQSGWLKVLKD